MGLANGPAYVAAFIAWMLLGPLGWWVGAASRYALEPKFGERAGPILIGGGALFLLALLVCVLPSAMANREIWAGAVAGWSVVLISFYVPFAVASAKQNSWIVLASLPLSGVISFYVATIFTGLGVR